MTYSEYLTHQASKLDRNRSRIEKHDQALENFVFKAHKAKGRVLCLGARLGGEVRAFKQQGCDAIGIDLNPGGNPDVIEGDFHNIPFGVEFDYLYTNSVDHVYDLDAFFSECRRVLKPGGVFIMDVVHVKKGDYEVRCTLDDREIIHKARCHFNVQKIRSEHVTFGLIDNQCTTYHLN